MMQANLIELGNAMQMTRPKIQSASATCSPWIDWKGKTTMSPYFLICYQRHILVLDCIPFVTLKCVSSMHRGSALKIGKIALTYKRFKCDSMCCFNSSRKSLSELASIFISRSKCKKILLREPNFWEDRHWSNESHPASAENKFLPCPTLTPGQVISISRVSMPLEEDEDWVIKRNSRRMCGYELRRWILRCRKDGNRLKSAGNFIGSTRQASNNPWCQYHSHDERFR